VPFHRLKFLEDALKKQTAGPSSSQNCQKVFNKDGSPLQHVNNPSSKLRLKLLTQNIFSAKSIYKCVIYDESFFTINGNEWHQQQSYYEFEDHPATEGVKFIRKTKFRVKVLLWLAVKSRSCSQQRSVIIQMGTSMYFINLSKNITKTKILCSSLI
jgi:hypothetical protein